MRILATTFLFLAGAASLVSASPAREETTARISYSETREAPRARPVIEPGWVELASPTPAKHGREFIMVGADAGAFTQLRLTAASGRPVIRSVRIHYADGRRRSYDVDKAIDAKRRPIYVDLLGPSAIRQVIVYSDKNSPGSYVVEANSGEPSRRTIAKR